jgi:lipopolysaccharide export system protein LptC
MSIEAYQTREREREREMFVDLRSECAVRLSVVNDERINYCTTKRMHVKAVTGRIVAH